MKKDELFRSLLCCMMVVMMPAAFAAGTTMDETAFRAAVAGRHCSHDRRCYPYEPTDHYEGV